MTSDMSSGYFPVQQSTEIAAKLMRAAVLLQEVIDECLDDVYDGDSGGGQFDNAASDGASLAMIGLARKLVVNEVRGGEEALKGATT